MNTYLRRAAGRLLPAAIALAFLATSSCSDDDLATPAPGGGSPNPTPPDAGSPPSSTDAIDEAALAACPQSSSLIQTSEWMACLVGRRAVGKEPFTNQPCELRIGANGVFEYLREGTVAIAVPDRSQWRSASGTYSNNRDATGRFFLASVAPDVKPVEGQPRVTDVALSYFPLASMEDKVEIKYLDAGLIRQTYNCTLDGS